MHAVLSSLVASSLLMHAVLGCCWHHGHASSCCDQSQSAQVAQNCCHHHDDVGCDDDHDEPAPTPCKGGPHCHGVCNYLPVQKTQLDPVQLAAPLDFAVAVLHSSDAHFVAAHGFEHLYELDTGPPLRLHLLHQILLI